AFLRSYPAIAELGMPIFHRRNLVAAKILDEGVVALQQRSIGQRRERDEVPPILGFRFEEIGGVGSAVLVLAFGGDGKRIGLADLPVVIEERLAAGAFVAETSNADLRVLVEQLDPAFFGNIFGIPLAAGVPDGKDHELLAVGELLN